MDTVCEPSNKLKNYKFLTPKVMYLTPSFIATMLASLQSKLIQPFHPHLQQPPHHHLQHPPLPSSSSTIQPYFQFTPVIYNQSPL